MNMKAMSVLVGVTNIEMGCKPSEGDVLVISVIKALDDVVEGTRKLILVDVAGVCLIG